MLYPDEWVVFIEPRIDASNTSFVGGVVDVHSRDQDVAFQRVEEVAGAGGIATFHTGEPKYRSVTFEPLDADPAPAA